MSTVPTRFSMLALAGALLGAPAALADNCSQVAAREAASRGADVLAVSAATQGGGTVCVIKLRIPGKGGQPPRVETVRANG